MERIKYKNRHLKTVSLFAGAGGLDLGFLNAGFDIIWANDVDKYAYESYRHNISDHIVLGDINQLLDDIPSHEVLIGGFPCQPFSMMGQQLGFEDERGTLFFTIEQIVRKHRPKVIVLENVKNLETHNGGETFARMQRILRDELLDDNGLGYSVFYQVLNSADFGIPQTRRRVFVVAFDRGYFNNINFEFPQPIELQQDLRDILDGNVDKKYFLSEKILPTILSHGTGNYYSKSEIDLRIARPLCATMHKMHRASQDNYVTDIENRRRFEDTEEKRISNVRRLTPNECKKLQGFPSEWEINVSDTQAYRQFGNAVTVDVAYNVAMQIVRALNITLEIEG
ncbi:DNA (cytosine-5)-methyltransferase 1 [Clostridium collagenovorans DSM 3089]|uniref:Cytosine-specific methyltransferase n=1 Tax=Clostridium collagenovorans DSM 3089 TaxID=1121306 RepID=A0A1M5YLR8_9CLOT|nr:DNA (cytosine-5-)-methyltransferase [Clostridium collagenovorans]SHI12910.1 DNA (cytosine-5)-methyltransferase 1 [Clostridium collagenovorans DSM 3089]